MPISTSDLAAGVNRWRERSEEIRAAAYLVHLVAVAGADVDEPITVIQAESFVGELGA